MAGRCDTTPLKVHWFLDAEEEESQLGSSLEVSPRRKGSVTKRLSKGSRVTCHSQGDGLDTYQPGGDEEAQLMTAEVPCARHRCRDREESDPRWREVLRNSSASDFPWAALRSVVL